MSSIMYHSRKREAVHGVFILSMLGDRREVGLSGQLSVAGVTKGDTWKANSLTCVLLPPRADYGGPDGSTQMSNLQLKHKSLNISVKVNS